MQLSASVLIVWCDVLTRICLVWTARVDHETVGRGRKTKWVEHQPKVHLRLGVMPQKHTVPVAPWTRFSSVAHPLSPRCTLDLLRWATIFQFGMHVYLRRWAGRDRAGHYGSVGLSAACNCKPDPAERARRRVSQELEKRIPGFRQPRFCEHGFFKEHQNTRTLQVRKGPCAKATRTKHARNQRACKNNIVPKTRVCYTRVHHWKSIYIHH